MLTRAHFNILQIMRDQEVFSEQELAEMRLQLEETRQNEMAQLVEFGATNNIQ